MTSSFYAARPFSFLSYARLFSRRLTQFLGSLIAAVATRALAVLAILAALAVLAAGTAVCEAAIDVGASLLGIARIELVGSDSVTSLAISYSSLEIGRHFILYLCLRFLVAGHLVAAVTTRSAASAAAAVSASA